MREPNKPPTGIAYGIYRWVGAMGLMPGPHPAHRHQLCGALLFCVRVQPGRPALGRGHIEYLGGGTSDRVLAGSEICLSQPGSWLFIERGSSTIPLPNIAIGARCYCVAVNWRFMVNKRPDRLPLKR